MLPPDPEAPEIPSPGPRCQGVVYSPTTFNLSVGVAMTPVTPTVVGASPRYWYVKPALPVGLVMNNGTGELSGTPTAPKASATYVVHAVHSDDEALVSLTIGVV